MKATSVSILLSVLAIGAVATLYVKVDELGERLTNSRADREAMNDGRPPESARYVVNSTAPNDMRRSERPSREATMEVDQKEDLVALQEEVALLRKQVEKNKGSVPRWSRPQFVRSVDDLATRLNLAPSQKDRVTVAIERGKERIEEILSIPGKDGKSPKEARQEQRKKIREALANPGKDGQNLVALAMSGPRRMSEKIPGRNETYREEIARVKKETREEVAQNLTADQKKQFKDTPIDPLIGSSGGSAVSIATSLGGDGSGGIGGFMVTEDVVIGSSDAEPVAVNPAGVPAESEEEEDGQ